MLYLKQRQSKQRNSWKKKQIIGVCVTIFGLINIRRLASLLTSGIEASSVLEKERTLQHPPAIEKGDGNIAGNVDDAHSIAGDEVIDLPQYLYQEIIEKKFISFKILRNFPFNFGYKDLDFKVAYAGCAGPRRAIFQASTQTGVMDFNAQIKTNLNILYIGSSIGHQFVQGFEEASAPVDRQIVRYAYGNWQENTFSSLTPDNGTISGLRITGLFLNKMKDKLKNISPRGGGGWLSYDVRELKRLAHSWRHITPINTAFGTRTSPCEIDNGNKNSTGVVLLLNETIDYPCEQKDFDLVVYQPPVEWVSHLPFDKALTWDALHEAVELSFNELGASTVILQTIPIQNNAKDLDVLVAVNRNIWKYAREFRAMATKAELQSDKNGTNPPTSTGENSTDVRYGHEKLAPKFLRRRILVMDLYSLSVASYLQNAIDIGIIGNVTGKELQSKLFFESIDDPFHFLNLTMVLNASIQNYTIPHRKHFTHGKIAKNPAGEIVYRKIGQSCGDANCTIQSSITYDGQHWCMSQFAGRLNAGVACLARCSLPSNNGGEELPTESKAMRSCERSCNAQYMSLVPIRWENGQETTVNGTAYAGFENYKKL